MSDIIVDVESDGPIPGEFSMVGFGAVLFDDNLDKTFYGRVRPVSERFVPEALAVSGFSREQHLGFDDPKPVMESFAVWLEQNTKGRAVFVSDNVAFDWQFINDYFHRFSGRNPKTWCRFPILSGGFEVELAELRQLLSNLRSAAL